jgi:DNA primase
MLRDMITVPVHSPTGIPVGFVGRSIEGKDFKNSKDLPRRENLFNLHRVKASSYVYLLESSFDVIRCHQLGIPAVSSLGSSVSKDQVSLIFKYFPEVYVVPDRDDGGRKMALTLMKNGATLIAVPEGYNDVGNLSDEGIKKLLDRSNPIAGLF